MLRRGAGTLPAVRPEGFEGDDGAVGVDAGVVDAVGGITVGGTRDDGIRRGRACERAARLLVGPDAYRYATAAGRDLLESDQKWEALSLSTAAGDATNDQLDPLGTGNG